MHIPDGLMDPIVAGAGWMVAIAALALATRFVSRRFEDERIPLMAVLAAGIFVAQMLNFPIGGGTTGHLVGAALAAILLGPASGMLIITIILVIQCLLFGDGGITALGLNFFNMGLIGSLTGFYVWRLFPERYRLAGVFVAAWLAVFLGALACSLELGLSHAMSGGAFGIALQIAVPAMTLYHAVIGVGEALITVGVLTFLGQVAPDMLRMAGKAPRVPEKAEVKADG
ncbi:MAG: energy-coupling factor ABC transporter permease [Thermoplasmatota archaeon]